MDVETWGNPEDFRAVYRIVHDAFGLRTVGVGKFRKEEIVSFAAILFRFFEPEFRTFVNGSFFRFALENGVFAIFSKGAFH